MRCVDANAASVAKARGTAAHLSGALRKAGHLSTRTREQAQVAHAQSAWTGAYFIYFFIFYPSMVWCCLGCCVEFQVSKLLSKS